MEGARQAAFESQHIDYYNQHKLRNVLIVLISEKINNETTDLNPVVVWNDCYCNNQQEAIKLMQEAERIIGLTPEKMIPSQTTKINNIVNVQIEETLNNIPVAYIEKETISV